MTINFELIKDEIVREMSDPWSPWTLTELTVRLVLVEMAEKSSFFGEFSEVFLEISSDV